MAASVRAIEPNADFTDLAQLWSIRFPTLVSSDDRFAEAIDTCADACHQELLEAPGPGPEIVQPAAEIVLSAAHEQLREREGSHLHGPLRRELYEAQAVAMQAIGTRAEAKRLQLQITEGRPLAICFGNTSYVAFVDRNTLARAIDLPETVRDLLVDDLIPESGLLRFATWRWLGGRDPNTGKRRQKPNADLSLPPAIYEFGDGCGLVYPASTETRGQRGSGGPRLYCDACSDQYSWFSRRARKDARAYLGLVDGSF